MGPTDGGLVLVTGANGYIASRLIPRLLEDGWRVRAAVREPGLLAGRAWTPKVEVMAADTRDPGRLAVAMAGVETAYYLIHSMASGRGYMEVERESARRFASTAAQAGVRHIIYLGGLADPQAKNLAPHMRSRIETGEILRQGSVPVTEFRAGVIVGAGSISFEMIRFLTEFFPLMVGPNWLRNKAQPIAAANVIDYLVAALSTRDAGGGIYELGGPDQMRYANTMLEYAKRRGLRRMLLTLPGIPIWLMARIVDQLTPVPYPIATPLVGGLQSDSFVRDDLARTRFPEIKLIPFPESLDVALGDLQPSRLEPVWQGLPGDAFQIKHEGFFIDHRRAEIKAPQDAVFGVLASMGGANAWPYADWLWRLRGWLDGLVAGSRKPPPLKRTVSGVAVAGGAIRRVGDQVDYYTVEAVEPGCLLRLHSVLRAPGEGWMEWRVDQVRTGVSVLMQTAYFAPRGLPGFIYWTVLGPVHRLVFGGLMRGIARRAKAG